MVEAEKKRCSECERTIPKPIGRPNKINLYREIVIGLYKRKPVIKKVADCINDLSYTSCWRIIKEFKRGKNDGDNR